MVCLNNTLGYIAEVSLAIRNMRRLGGVVVLSVFGPRFDGAVASEYFRSLGTTVDRLEGGMFTVGFLGDVSRFSRDTVDFWGGAVSETPLGYWVALP